MCRFLNVFLHSQKCGLNPHGVTELNSFYIDFQLGFENQTAPMKPLASNNSHFLRILEKPPRPRISKSPAPRIQKAIPESPDEFTTSPKKDLPEQWDDRNYTSREPEWIDLPVHEHDSAQAQPQLASSTDDQSADVSLTEPNLDVPDLRNWIEETSKLDPVGVYPLPSNRFTQLRNFEPRGSPPLHIKPEDDILAQWRLRRKIEQAHSETRQRTSAAYGTLSYNWREPSSYHDCTRHAPPFTYSHRPITNQNRSCSIPSNVCSRATCCPSHFERDMGVQTNPCTVSSATKDVACETTDLVCREHPIMHTRSTSTKFVTRSVGLTASPRVRHVCVQTSAHYEQHQRSSVSDSHELLSTAVAQCKSCTCSNAIGAPKEILSSILGTVPEPEKIDSHQPTQLSDTGRESAQITETDSWQWQSTPRTPEPLDFASSTRLSPASGRAFLHCARTFEDTPVQDAPRCSERQCTSFHEAVSRYLQETAPQVTSSQYWLHDPIVKDLCERRDRCLLDIMSLMQKIHLQEIKLLENARVQGEVE
ncbi:hypothetical protein FGIG_08458 [Fasciola gigantica]|uniref:Uncharacterized protein n=1 Tax=Fasciola gigantica TaxID=46835 RepID=A0A504YHI7_FASGI|nr:hypothetical protein FGIG_08458 [Fasciola gigantica]